MHVGDSLEDDFAPDDLVALSGDEDLVAEDEEDDGSVSAEGESSLQPSSAADAAATLAKKRKRREKEKEKKAKKRRMEGTIELVQPVSLAAQPPLQLSDYLVSKQLKTFTKLSEIELDDLRIPDTAIADTTAWTSERSLDHFADFVSKVLPALRTRLGQRPKNNGAPTLLFISSAALRVTDVARRLKARQLRGEKGGDVAKLFAKHFKVEDHVRYLKTTKLSAAAGTPDRIGKLLELDALAVTALSHVVLDVTYHDSKKRSLLDIPETRDAVFKTVLASPKLLNAVKQGKVQVVLF